MSMTRTELREYVKEMIIWAIDGLIAEEKEKPITYLLKGSAFHSNGNSEVVTEMEHQKKRIEKFLGIE